MLAEVYYGRLNSRLADVWSVRGAKNKAFC